MARETVGNPLVSVVIPTYYRNELLSDALRSVSNQTYTPIETIVVDDSGEGHARRTVARFDDVRYIELPENVGPNRSRYTGFERATGRLIHFLDDDDSMMRDKIERQVALFESTDDVGVVYCGVMKGRGLIDHPDPRARGDVLQQALAFDMWPCMTSTMLIEASALDRILPVTDRPGGDDLAIMIELATITRFDFVDAPLLRKRIDTGSRGHSMSAIQSRLRIVEDYARLYDRFPDSVRRSAIARTHKDRGNLLLKERFWSPAAIRAFFDFLRYEPDVDVASVGLFIASLFGRPGLDAAQFLDERFIRG